MLSDRERRVWDELERSYDVEAAGPPPRPRPPGGRWARSRLRASVVVGIAGVICLLLLVAGAALGALALAVAAGIGWCLWRYRAALEAASRDAGPRPDRTGESS